jgi:predicted Zn-dependent protease
VVAERQGRLPEARDALLQYVALVGDREPQAAVATRIADLSLRIGEPLLAARWIDRAIDESGPSPALLARLADAAWRGGDMARARQAVTAGLELAPKDTALQALGRRVSAGASRP